MNADFSKRQKRLVVCAALVLLSVSVLTLPSLMAQEDNDNRPSGEQPDNELLKEVRELLKSAPPVGCVIAYFGAKSDIGNAAVGMERWELCDGTIVQDKESKLFGKTKPDLNERFVIGTTTDVNLAETPIQGGVNETPVIPLGSTNNTKLTVEQMPSHEHPHWHYVAHNSVAGTPRMLTDKLPNGHIRTQGTAGGESRYVLIGGGETPNAGMTNSVGGATGGNEPHDHSLPGVPVHDNRPAHVGLFYIIRVK